MLDSWAVLRLLEGAEPSATRVEQVIADGRAVMSWVNVGEAFYILRRHQGDAAAHDVVRDLQTNVDLDLPTEQRVLDAAAIKADHAMAYADAFAAATASAHRATLVTGDPELLIVDAAWDWEDLRPQQ